MILKRMTQNAGGDYCKSLRQRSWAALAILAIGLTGLGCYLWLVPGSGLSDHAQGFYLGGACGITAGGLGLLIRNQWMLRHPEKWRKARIQETDERNQRIAAQAAQLAGGGSVLPPGIGCLSVGSSRPATGDGAAVLHGGLHPAVPGGPVRPVPKAMSARRRLELPITGALAGIKVDTLLKRHLGLSGTVVRRIKWLEDGILVDGARVNTRFCPQEGQVLSVRLSDPERRSGILPAPGPLDVVYEDGDVVVLNKAPGCPSTPARGIIPILWGIIFSIITIRRGQRGIFTPSTAWTGGPPACWWWPATLMPRRC